MSSSKPSQGSKRAGYVLHVLTASGAAAGLVALQAVFNGEWRQALLWLIVCQVLDGLDGPIARKIDVTIHAPRIDGHILDLVVDYLTCVVVPVALLASLELLPLRFEIWVAGAIFITSALWFARIDQETDDHWFNGFPAAWNIVVPTLLILDANKATKQLVILFLCGLSLSKVQFPHIVRVTKFRPVTLSVAFIYFVALTWLSAQYPDGPSWVKPILVIAPLYIVGLSIWKTWFARDNHQSM